MKTKGLHIQGQGQYIILALMMIQQMYLLE